MTSGFRKIRAPKTEEMTLAVKVSPVLKRSFVVVPFIGTFATVTDFASRLLKLYSHKLNYEDV